MYSPTSSLQESADGDTSEKAQAFTSDAELSTPIPYYAREVPVTFSPSLNDTRRAWILKKLRQERVSSVLDVGCGVGTLLHCLCNPPAFLNPEKNKDGLGGRYDADLFCTTISEDSLPELQVSRIAGLDVSRRALEKCIISTVPRPTDYRLVMPRWHRLEVKVWHGSLDVYNPEFEGVDCIVSSEVIEHLPPSLLASFAPTLLGLYRPRVLLITTPNYTFNARFTAPGVRNSGGFLDPTGRTDRVFRHHDHKFEWTSSEFEAWCKDAAAAWGYFVEVDAVGTAMEPDPWGREDELGGASQVALFRRNDGWQGQRPVPSHPSEETAHRQLKIHIHPAHPRAGIPESHEKICELVIKYMESYYYDHGYSVWELWVGNTISIACGGRFDVLLSAINSTPSLLLTRKDGTGAKEWNGKFAGDKHQEALEATKKQHRESRFPHDCRLTNELEAGDTPATEWPDPAKEWYALANKAPLENEKAMSSDEDEWWASKACKWPVGWEEAKTTNVCA